MKHKRIDRKLPTTDLRRWLGWIAIGLLLTIAAIALFAYGDQRRPVSLDARTQALAAQLRCPVCQGESIADSQSDIAQGIRRLIRRDLAAGQSEGQITSYLQSRYAGISLAPSTSGIGSIAWIAPPLLLLAGLALLLTLVADWRGRGRRQSRPTEAIYLERVRRELAADEV